DRGRGAHHRRPPVQGTVDRRRQAWCRRLHAVPRHPIAAARTGAARGARTFLALPAGRRELSGARPLAAPRRIIARLRAHLSAALAHCQFLTTPALATVRRVATPDDG